MSGIVRKIDELGRIVIPKEIRKALRIKDGEALEIIVNDDSITLKKFSEFKDFKELASKYVETLTKFLTYDILVTDRDTFTIATGNLKKKYLDKKISNYLETFIEERNNYKVIEETINLIDKETIKSNIVIAPINVSGDIVGLVIVDFQDKKADEMSQILIKVIAQLIAKHIEQ